MIKKLLARLHRSANLSLPVEVKQYIEASYPNNHNYTIHHDKLVPLQKLAQRSRQIRRLYPQLLTSLLDLSCSKGYFVLDASLQESCERSLGVDVFDTDLQICGVVQRYLQCEKATFVQFYLHELTERINEYGGPYQTVLLINTYQYLFFGSDRNPACYLSHDAIFRQIRQVCSGRLIFNNRTELSHCQNRLQIERAGDKAAEYNTQAIFDAASRYFTVASHGTLGRYPLWSMDV